MEKPEARDRSAAMNAPRRGLVARTAFLLLLAACGSRTGLFGTEDGVNGLLPDGGPIPPGFDGGRDGSFPFDAPFEPDSPLPPIDAAPRPDANRTDCPDADATLVYVVTDKNELYSYFPTDNTFKFISNLTCPVSDPMSIFPFSMAVDRRGVAYVEFTDHRLYRVSTATGACIGTSFQPDQQGFGEFGMGFATNSVGPTETLFVAGTEVRDQNGQIIMASPGLGRVDPMSFILSPVGPFIPNINGAELTGTGDGRLFAFYNKTPDFNGQGNQAPSYIGEINTNTAHVVAETPFPTVAQGFGWAFAFWGGDFYMFTAGDPNGGSDVTRWRPSDNSVTVVTSLPSKIVGAGVSTCAPAQ